MQIATIKNLTYIYPGTSAAVLTDVSATFSKGEIVAICGKSGSGKSTLFHLVGGMISVPPGHVMVDGLDLGSCDESTLAWYRGCKIGFVFQQFHLLPRVTVWDNILLPLKIVNGAGMDSEAVESRARQLVRDLELEPYLTKYPNQLSGGQQQRVAIARALIFDADMILADEPTGNLDPENTRMVMTILKGLAKAGKTILLITHDQAIAAQCDRTLELELGQLKGPCDEAKESGPAARNVLSLPIISVDQNVFPLGLVWLNLRRSISRVMLTSLGIVIGVAALLAVLGLGRLARDRILDSYESLGANKAIISADINWDEPTTGQGTVRFKSFDPRFELPQLKNRFPEIKLIGPITFLWIRSFTFQGSKVQDIAEAPLVGVGYEHFQIIDDKLLAGRRFSDLHIADGARVAVIGSKAAKILRRSPEELIGEDFAVERPVGNTNQKFSFKIIGVIQDKESTKETSYFESQLLIPYTTARVLGTNWESDIRKFEMRIEPIEQVQAIGKAVTSYFEKKYGKTGKFTLATEAETIRHMRLFLAVFMALLTFVAGLSLLVGGIGIYNMMLVSVSDRLREIGLMKALGATNHLVFRIFLMEALSICLAAGAFGVLCGLVATELGSYAASQLIPQFKFHWYFDVVSIFAATLAVLVVGVVSGLKPAKKAENLNIIEALRFD
jgi:macrolide transport system ATP-binding/permease protein